MSNVKRKLALGLVMVTTASLVGVLDLGGRAEAVGATARFEKVFSANANGAILTFGNNLLTCPSTSRYCATAQSGGAYDNNSFAMVNLDEDSDATTFNSSASTLALPDGARVLHARLYWGARLKAGTDGKAASSASAPTVKFKVPGASAYEALTGDLIALNTGQNGAYQGVFDVTSRIQDAGDGEYWVADVQAATGYDRYAGWAITVVYTAPGLPLRNLTLFEGFNTVGSGSPQSITVSGFVAPTTGLVDAQLSMTAYEGDLAQTGDYTRLNTSQLATPVSPGSNFFDSVNSLAGASVTTRRPAFKNMFGFDIKNLGVSGVIPNGAESATFQFASAGDVYYPGVLALAINLYAPDFTASTKTAVNVTSPNALANPGDTLQYTLTYANTGQDGAKGVSSCDPLPDAVTYVPGSLWLMGTADPAVFTPVNLKDDGTDVGYYDESQHALCMNLGRGAGPYNTGAGGFIDVLEATSYQFRVTVDESAGGETLRNIAHLYYTTETTNLAAVFDTPPAATPVGLKADVKIAKSMDPPEAIAGRAGVTTLLVTNEGPSRATGVVVTDPLPAEYRVTQTPTWEARDLSGLTGSCPSPAAPGDPVVCSLPDLAPGQRIAISIAGRPLANSTATSLANVASVSTSSFDPNLANNVDTVSIPMTHQADLEIVKSPDPLPATPGAEVTWTLRVANLCSSPSATNPAGCLSDATGVVITDTVTEPTKLILTGATGGDGSGGAAGDVAVDCPSAQVKASTAQCVVAGADGRLRPGQTAVVTVTGYIAGNVTAGTLVNQAAVTSATFDPDQTNNLDAAVVTPSAPVSDIQLIKTGPASAVGGRTVDYTITAENFGPSDASDVEIVDVFPAALTATAATKVATDRGTCLINVPASTVVCSIATLPGPSVPGGPGAKATITITGAMVDASRTASFTNTATITCGGAACVEGPSPKPDTPAVTTGVTSLADLAVTKTTATSYVPQPTQTVTYHVQVRNLGPSTALGVRLEDELPSGMTATGMSLAGGSPDSCDVTQLVCQIGTLPVGGLAEIEITARVGAAWLIEPVVQTARVTADTVDPVDANNTARWTHSGDALADLRISKTSTGLGAGRAGDSYTLTIQNFGPQAALEPEVRDSIPPGLAVGALPSGTGWSCGVSGTVTDGHTVTCGYDALNSLAVGEAWTIVIPVALPADADPGQVFVNTATVAAETKDPSEANNTASARDVSVAEADIEIDYQIGYGIEYTGPGLDDWQLVTDPTGYYTGPGSVRFAQITVRNNGPAEARDLQGLSNVAAPAIPDLNSLPAGCVAVNQQVVCALSTVALAASTSFRFVAPFTVAPSTSPGSFPDCGFQMACSPGQTPGGWASVSTSTAETDVTNNYDTAALIVGAPRTDLRISKVALSTIENPDDQHPAYVAGEKFGYRIDLWAPATWDDVEELNHLVADAQGVVLEDTLPAGFTATQVNTGQGTCDPIDPGNPGAIRCEIGTVTASTDARGAPHTVSIYVYGSIATSAAAEITGGGGAVNRATADSQTRALDGSPTFVEATVETDVIQRADLQVSKLPDADRSYAGTSVGYTVTALNNGPSVAVGVVVTDTLPPGLALDEVASPGCAVARVETPVGQPSYQVVECVPELEGSAAGVIPAGASANLRIVASTDPRDLRPYWCAGQDPVTDPVMECPEVLPPADLSARQLVNLVEVTSDATDTKPENNSASVTTELATLADVAVAASVTTDTPAAGSLVTYNLSGVNLGPSVFDNPVVVVTLPPGFVVVEGGVQVDETVMTCEVTHVGEALQAVYSVTCSALAATPIRDSFEPGYTIPGGITVWIPPETPAGAYTATGHAYSRADVECPAPGAGTCESNYANNTASVTVNVVERADTSLEKRLVAPNPIQAGADVVYELTATNAGPSVAQDVTIADTVPAGMTYVSGEVLGGAACPSPEQIDENNVVKCQAGTIQPGESKTVRLTFHVDWRERGELCNTALVGSGALDPNAADNAAAACAETVAIPTDVGVTATADEGVVKVGGPVGYTVVVANNGPSPTAGTVVLVTVPAGLRDTKVVLSEHTGSVAPDPVCALDGEAYSCAVGDFWVGDTLTYRVTGTAAGNAGASLGIRVHVSHDDSDSDPSNDDAAASVTLEADDGSGGGLPVSGADIVWAVGAALALLAAGTALRGARRIKSPNRSGAL